MQPRKSTKGTNLSRLASGVARGVTSEPWSRWPRGSNRSDSSSALTWGDGHSRAVPLKGGNWEQHSLTEWLSEGTEEDQALYTQVYLSSPGGLPSRPWCLWHQDCLAEIFLDKIMGCRSTFFLEDPDLCSLCRGVRVAKLCFWVCQYDTLWHCLWHLDSLLDWFHTCFRTRSCRGIPKALRCSSNSWRENTISRHYV